MAPSLPRRRFLEPDDEATKNPFLPTSTTHRASSSFLSSLPIFFVFLLLLAVWCIFFRNLDHPASASVPIQNTVNTNQDIGHAIYKAWKQDRTMRSWTSPETSKNNSLIRSCDGRGVFVYDLPPKFNKDILVQCSDMIPWVSLCDLLGNQGMGQPVPELGKRCYTTYQHSLEIMFHSRILNHPCRVGNPADAALFYVPFYGGLDTLQWHFKNVSNGVKDALGLELVRWLETQWPWSRNGGRDHMFVLGLISDDFHRWEQGSWGSNLLVLDQMRGPYKFLIERLPWEMKEIGVPYPTSFHPHDDSDIIDWQARIANSPRTRLVTFAGGVRARAASELRSVLTENCVSNAGFCRLIDCNSGSCTSEAVTTAFMESEFCLQPPGDSPTRKSMFDSLVSGCIPVFFSKFTVYYQYPWHLPDDLRKYSVYIDQEKVQKGKVDVIEMLKKTPLEKRKEIRRFIVHELMPGLVYGDSSSEFVRFRDAFGIVMDHVIDLMAKTAK